MHASVYSSSLLRCSATAINCMIAASAAKTLLHGLQAPCKPLLLHAPCPIICHAGGMCTGVPDCNECARPDCALVQPTPHGQAVAGNSLAQACATPLHATLFNASMRKYLGNWTVRRLSAWTLERSSASYRTLQPPWAIAFSSASINSPATLQPVWSWIS